MFEESVMSQSLMTSQVNEPRQFSRHISEQLHRIPQVNSLTDLDGFTPAFQTIVGPPYLQSPHSQDSTNEPQFKNTCKIKKLQL